MPARIHEPDDATIAAAAARLAEGGLVALPTETVYGLGADARSDAAAAGIYAAKGRPAGNPLIVHVAAGAPPTAWVRSWTPQAARLADAFWPGPLTLVLAASEHASTTVRAGGDTVALRCPDHPVAQRLLAAFGSGIAAPSANRSGSISPTTAAAVATELAGAPGELMVIDGGPCPVGIESTIVDVSGPAPRLLRPGTITAEDVAACLGTPLEAAGAGSPAHPGSAPRHYAPGTPLVLAAPDELASAVAGAHATREPFVVLARAWPAGVPSTGGTLLELPGTLPELARDIYRLLREADGAGAARIVCELPEGSGIGMALRDRLTRAATPAG